MKRYSFEFHGKVYETHSNYPFTIAMVTICKSGHNKGKLAICWCDELTSKNNHPWASADIEQFTYQLIGE